MAEKENSTKTEKSIQDQSGDATDNLPKTGTPVETIPGRFELRTTNPWEEVCGHTRAVRRGPFVIISGTTASHPTKGILYPENIYKQTVAVFECITNALLAIGAQLTDVVRVRILVTDMADQHEVCRAFKETFHPCGVRVPCTLVQVSAFVHPDIRVEIEADAIVLESGSSAPMLK